MSQAGTLTSGGGGGGVEVETLTGNSGGAVSPTANNINIVGSGTISVVGTPGTSTLTISSSGSGTVSTVNGTANQITSTNPTGPTVTLSTPTTFIAPGSIASTTSLAAGTYLSLPVTTSTAGYIAFTSSEYNIGSWGPTNSGNFFIGAGNTTLTGTSNLGYGLESLESLTSGSDNVAAGILALSSLTTGSNNVAIGGTNGSAILANLVSGSSNVAIGAGSGTAYTTSESSNILMSNAGVVGESNTIRIGTQGTSAGQQNSCYIAGIQGVTPTGTLQYVTINSSGQLGSTVETLAPNYTSINSAASPYTVLSTDYYISADPTSGAITVKLPNAPTTSRVIIIKDRTGRAAANNISITTVGGTVTIDGATTLTMTGNYQAIQLLFNGTSYEVF